MTTERVGILGCGLMGAGIAEVVSCAGYDVRVLEQNRAALDAGNARINRLIDRAVDTGGISPELRALSLGRISYSTEVEELGDRDLIIEAVVEDLEIKNQLFRELDGFCATQGTRRFSRRTPPPASGDRALTGGKKTAPRRQPRGQHR